MLDDLQAILNEACVALFVSFGIDLRVAGAPSSQGRGVPPSGPHGVLLPRLHERVTAGLLSFRGSNVRGTLLLRSTFGLVAASCPLLGRIRPLSPQSAADWIYVRDWVRELTNMLFHRIKNRLVASGLDLEGRLPIALTGGALEAEVTARTSPLLRFETGTDDVDLWFDAVIPEGVDLRPARAASADPERKIILF
jgi:hypothetical protein